MVRYSVRGLGGLFLFLSYAACQSEAVRSPGDSGIDSHSASPADGAVVDGRSSVPADSRVVFPDAGPGADPSVTSDAATVPDAGCASSVAPEPGLVVTDHGAVRAKDEGTVWAFLGLPFAAPPVGELRFMPPQEPACWSDILSTNALPPSCPQVERPQFGGDGTPLGQEDCLYLNVWTPKSANPASLPVLVYIHGGGNVQGSSNAEGFGTLIYDGGRIVEQSDVVVVTMQYRLGPLGFLVLPDSVASDRSNPTAGNLGLRDQIFALRWVQRHAARFGGDPNKVLLFGESGGAVDTCMHLASPLSAGLFSRALMQSGACVAAPRAQREQEGLDFLAEMGCAEDGDPVGCLRSLSAETLTSAVPPPLSGGLVAMSFGPVIDGLVLPKAPLKAIEAGEHNKVPFVVGSNADEMAVSIAPGTARPAMVRALIAKFPREFHDRLLEFYPPGTTEAEARDSLIRATSDAQFTCTARAIARAARGSQSAPVFRYFFTQPTPGPLESAYGAFHGLELFYLFQGLESSSVARSVTDEDRELSSLMLAYWTRFAATGDPNGSTGPSWSAYDVGSDATLELKGSSSMTDHVRSEACDLWAEVQASLPR